MTEPTDLTTADAAAELPAFDSEPRRFLTAWINAGQPHTIAVAGGCAPTVTHLHELLGYHAYAAAKLEQAATAAEEPCWKGTETAAYAGRLNVLLTHERGVLRPDEEAAVLGLLTERQELLADRRELTSLLEQALIDLRHARDERSDVWLAERLEVLRDATLEAAELLHRLSAPGPCDYDGDGACRGHEGFASGYLAPCPYPLGRRFVETWGTQASATDGAGDEAAPGAAGDTLAAEQRADGLRDLTKLEGPQRGSQGHEASGACWCASGRRYSCCEGPR